MASKQVVTKLKAKKEKVIGFDNLEGDPIVENPKETKNAKAQIQEKEKIEDVLTKPSEKLEPLQSGQAYFEAPDGTIIVGEKTNQQIWYRKGNNGKGMWINPKR